MTDLQSDKIRDFGSDREKEKGLSLFLTRIGKEKEKSLARLAKKVKAVARQNPQAIKRVKPPRIIKAGVLQQRVAVRMAYAANKGDGQWAAHGRYIERDSAAMDQSQYHQEGRSFDQTGRGIDASSRLRDWQEAGDPRIFKMIISPEFGEKYDLEEYTKRYMQRLEKDLGRPLEWLAVDHYNTDNPHVHVVIRGIDRDGQELNIPKEYIKHGLRQAARELGTQHIGFRSEIDVRNALEKQVEKSRFTDIDRSLKKAAEAKQWYRGDRFVFNFDQAGKEWEREQRLFMIKRLVHLEKIGLAQKTGNMEWEVRGDFEQALRARQMAEDRLKTMHRHNEMISDARLEFRVLDRDAVQGRTLGRVIGVGEDESKMRPYALIEAVDGRIYYHTSQDLMKTGQVVSIINDPKSGLKVYREGDAARMNDPASYLQFAERLTEAGVTVQPQGFGGWVGEMQTGLAAAQDAMLSKGVAVRRDGRIQFVQPARERGISR